MNYVKNKRQNKNITEHVFETCKNSQSVPAACTRAYQSLTIFGLLTQLYKYLHTYVLMHMRTLATCLYSSESR